MGLNLVDNALKYGGPAGPVRVEVDGPLPWELARDPGREGTTLLAPVRAVSGPFVAVRVSNGGPSIPHDLLPRLSERFYRAPGQTQPGTGLGLAIVKHIVNRHRGGLAVASEPGGETTFCAVFPLALASDETLGPS